MYGSSTRSNFEGSGKSDGLLTTIGVLVVGYTYKYYPIDKVTLYNLFLQPTTVFLAYFILKDKLSRREWMGNIIILIAFIIFQIAQ